MFESWAKVMSGILHNAGIRGLLTNTEDFYSSMAEDDQNLSEFVAVWLARFHEEVVRAADLMPIAQDLLDLGKGSEKSQATILGQTLRENRDRRFGDLTIRRATGVQHGAPLWRLERT